MGYSRFLLLFFVLFLNIQAFSQIVFKDFPDYRINTDTAFFDINSRRNIIPLNGEWIVFSGNNRENQKKIRVPSVFTGQGELIFERSISLTKEQISENKMEIHFLGLNYTADISVNNNIIYRHPGGEYPFTLDLPRDLLTSEKRNILSVKLNYHLDPESTIPVKQRFMFPHNYGGILKDVFIKLLPNISIADVNVSYTINPARNSAGFSIISKVDNREFRKDEDTLAASNNFSFRVRFIAPGGQTQNLADYNFNLPVNSDYEIKQTAEISSPALWSPSSPQYYSVNLELYRGNELLDVTTRRVAVYSLEAGTDSLTLNNRSFTLNGVTYVPSFYDYGSLYSYQQMERDISIIKEAGFNAIRFAKSIPHPYLIYQCERMGLLAFIEMPVNFIPSGLADDVNFMNRSKGFMGSVLRAFRNYSIIAAVGVGSSLLPDVDGHITYVNELTAFLKDRGMRSYASFAGIRDMNPIPNLDFYGLELFNTSVTEVAEDLILLQERIGAGRIIISSATYVVNAGNTNGYINEHSFEAQAKYFEDLIDFTRNSPLPGYFINSMFDYRGDYQSLISGYSDENLYRIGILGENRATDRLGYKIISAKLHNTETPTIPIGSKKDNAPMVFILFGLAIALLVGVLINSGRKFREDASRALLRPYNFYADVRDQRIMSGFQATLLALIISAVSALLLSNLLFYFRQEIKFEKILLAFGSRDLMDTVAYLAWNPGAALLWLSIGSLAALIIITIIVKMASFFVRTRVYMSGIYYAVVWSFLPLVLLIPVGIILFRLLDAEYTNMYIFIGLILVTIWILYRLMKGIYVIFDVNPGGVYFYSFVFLLVVIGGIIVVYEIQSSVISYLSLTVKQYKLFG